MSWFARSIANTLRLDDDDDENDVVSTPDRNHSTDKSNQQTDDDDPTRGVKEDLSELSKTLTRQFWGVASFLAPPPQSDSVSELGRNADPEQPDPAGIGGLRSDFAEIGGKFRTGISQLSKNIPVSEFTKIASNLLQLGEEEEDEEEEKRVDMGNTGAVGVTEEVVAFVRDIAMHPETWLDFPLPDDDDEEVDFELSDAQQEHALAVESLAPRLAALRIELCPGYMSEARFWEIYFVLLHPRLDKEDALLLSTPQVIKARASLSLELRRRTKPIEEDWSKEIFELTDRNSSQHEEMLAVPSPALSADVVQQMSGVESPPAAVPDSGTKAHSVISENQMDDKHVVEGGPTTNSKDEKLQSSPSSTVSISGIEAHPVISANETVDKLVKGEPIANNKDYKLQSASTTKLADSDEDDGDDDWLKEEGTETIGPTKTSMSIEDEEDVSFSDLEEDDSDVPTISKKVDSNSDKASRDWVQLRKSSSNSSRDTANQVGSVKENVQNPDSKESNDWLDIDDIEVA